MKHLVVLAPNLGLLSFQLVQIFFFYSPLLLFVLKDYDLFLVLFCESVVPDDETSILLCAQLAVCADTHVSLFFVLAELGDGALHLLQTLVEFFNLVCIAFLALVTVSQITGHVILVELH